MTRLEISGSENFAKASSLTLLSKIQRVIDVEIQQSTILLMNNDGDMTSSSLPPEDVVVYGSGELEMDDHMQRPTLPTPRRRSTTIPTVPEFHVNEIITGHVLGRGGFCYVAELNEIRLVMKKNNKLSSSASDIVSSGSSKAGKFFGRIANDNHNEHTVTTTENKNNNQRSLSSNTGANNPREYLARRVWSKGGTSYVVKQVDTSFLKSSASSSSMHEKKVQFMRATIDIMLEAKYLQSLSHPHIISVVGIVTSGRTQQQADNCKNQSSSNTVRTNQSKTSLRESSSSNCLRFGIIFEKLPKMLTSRLNDWMQEERRTSGVTGFFVRKKNQRITNLLQDRLFVAHDIAEALDYIQSHNIIYRDLKPDNIGFDDDGILKIFDFGLAKELRAEHQDELGLYHNMTGLTGAIRYMAPEVGLSQPYNLKADVYSWSMVLWYIMALEPPMAMFSPKMIIERVFQKNYRPAVWDNWSPNLCLLMKRCWDSKIQKRPDFRTILKELRNEIKAIDPDISGIFHESNRSLVSSSSRPARESQGDNLTETTLGSSKC